MSDSNSTIALIDFGPCALYVNRAEQTVKTVFRDGTIVLAQPEDTQEYLQQARDAGYGADPWAYCVHRDLFRTMLARAEGLSYSHVLHRLAHGLRPDLHEGGVEDVHLASFLKRLTAATGRL